MKINLTLEQVLSHGLDRVNRFIEIGDFQTAGRFAAMMVKASNRWGTYRRTGSELMRSAEWEMTKRKMSGKQS